MYVIMQKMVLFDLFVIFFRNKMEPVNAERGSLTDIVEAICQISNDTEPHADVPASSSVDTPKQQPSPNNGARFLIRHRRSAFFFYFYCLYTICATEVHLTRAPVVLHRFLVHRQTTQSLVDRLLVIRRRQAIYTEIGEHFAALATMYHNLSATDDALIGQFVAAVNAAPQNQ